MILGDGSRVNSAEPNSTYASVPVATTVVTTVRINSKFDWLNRSSSPTPSARTTLTKTF